MVADPATLDFIHLVQQAALRQAAQRSQKLNTLAGADDTAAHQASADEETAAAVERREQREIDVEELTQLYHDEKAANDATQADLHSRLDELAQQDDTGLDKAGAYNSRRGTREIELARLDWEIERLEDQITSAPLPIPIPVSTVSTRATLSDLNAQYSTALPRLKQQLTSETAQLEADKQLLSDLQVVEAGLRKRLEQVEVRLAEERDQGSEQVLQKLRRKAEANEDEMGRLLRHLIAVVSEIIEDKQRMRELRLLIEALMNRAWDMPQDPYVQVSGATIGGGGGNSAAQRNYDSALVEFAIRANFAVQHPRDARKIRLVAFGKPTRARV